MSCFHLDMPFYNLPAAFAMHDTLARKGDMKLTAM